jgi:hypothetical protein
VYYGVPLRAGGGHAGAPSGQSQTRGPCTGSHGPTAAGGGRCAMVAITIQAGQQAAARSAAHRSMASRQPSQKSWPQATSMRGTTAPAVL